MAIIHNKTGSLSELLARLEKQDVRDFHTLEDVSSFFKDYKNSIDLIRKRNKIIYRMI